jgi:uncharacterized protein (UPF0333 family)
MTFDMLMMLQRVLLGLLAAILVALAEAVLYVIFTNSSSRVVSLPVVRPRSRKAAVNTEKEAVAVTEMANDSMLTDVPSGETTPGLRHRVTSGNS